jgi:hypothetical protein
MVLEEEQIAEANGNHRSIYLPVARNVQPEVLAVFDFSEPSVVTGVRDTTIVPPQALYMLNSNFVEEQARALAGRVMEVSGFAQRFTTACQLVWCRDPYPDELAAARELGRHDDLDAWTGICRSLFAAADFLFIN